MEHGTWNRNMEQEHGTWNRNMEHGIGTWDMEHGIGIDILAITSDYTQKDLARD